MASKKSKAFAENVAKIARNIMASKKSKFAEDVAKIVASKKSKTPSPTFTPALFPAPPPLVVPCNGRVDVCMTVSRGDNDEWRLDITDSQSRVLVLRLVLDPQQFTRMITSHHLSDLPVEYGPLEMVGTRHEAKSVRVHFTRFIDKETPAQRLERKREAVREFEVDGWEANLDDFDNHHHWIAGQDLIVIKFKRWVRPDGTPVESQK